MQRFEAFLPDLRTVRVGEERCLFLRDLTPGRGKYAARCARVRLLAPDDPTGTDGELQLRSRTGQAVAGRWRLRILQDLPDLVPGAPYTDAYQALERATAVVPPPPGPDPGA